MLGRFFELEKRQTNIRTEVVAGLTTFLTMAYIILVNPNILSDQTGMNKEALIAVTCIVTAAATIATGLLANAPHSHGRRGWVSTASLPFSWLRGKWIISLFSLLFLALDQLPEVFKYVQTLLT